jgi:DNA invertase Pin-like site-specific DNA recombinase
MTIPTFQKVQSATPLNPVTFEQYRNNVIRFAANGQSQDTPEGITALYERLSQEDKNDGESNSIANQKKILERYCKTHGYTPFQHYDEDDGYSGTNFDRPGFQRMLSDIKAGRITRVVVKDMSRFGRDYLQVGMYTDVLFPVYGVHFVAVNDGVDSTRGENEFTAIRNVFNEMYARDTSKKIRATFQSKGKSGEHLSSHPPYGYMKDPADPRSGLSTRKPQQSYKRYSLYVLTAWGRHKLRGGSRRAESSLRLNTIRHERTGKQRSWYKSLLGGRVLLWQIYSTVSSIWDIP